MLCEFNEPMETSISSRSSCMYDTSFANYFELEIKFSVKFRFGVIGDVIDSMYS